MKLQIKSVIALALSIVSLTAGAQDLKTAYFLDGFLYRHQMNPAIGNDSTTYISFPGLGNINASEHGSFGVQDIILDNPMYPATSSKKHTTFLNPYIPADQALAGFSKNNRMLTDFKIGLLSAGWRGKNGTYNTFDINVRFTEGSSIPYEFFEFAKNAGNKHYDIGDISASAQTYVELGFGHSRDINSRLRLGAKLKVLIGAASADLAMNNLTADLSNTNKWVIQGNAQANVSMKGLKFIKERKEYKTEGAGYYEAINDAEIDGGGIGGFGAAIDLGATYKLLDNLTLSASILDLGFISWSNDIYAENATKSFEFDGFHDISVNKGDDTSLSKLGDKYSDQLTDFLNLQDRGDKGGRTTTLAATLNLGAQYVLPSYDKLSFGLLNSTRINGSYSWTEFRASANWKPLRQIQAALSAAAGSFGTTAGWALNIHPKKGLGLFCGMDYLLRSVDENMIPLTSNMTLSLGLNFAW